MDNNELLKVQKKVEAYGAIIEEMLHGASDTSACQKHGVDLFRFRNFVEEKTDSDKIPYSWQDKLLSELLYLSVYAGDEFNETWDEVSAVLTDDERTALMAYYESNMNYKEIGEVYHYGEQTAIDLINSAMTKLREPVNINSLKYGLLYRDKALNRSTDTEQRNKNREILDSICFGEFILTDELESVPIEDMDFSVRAYNILKRGGCSTALDIYKVGTSSEKSLYSLRNMGSKVFKEIYTKMMLRFNIDCTQKQG